MFRAGSAARGEGTLSKMRVSGIVILCALVAPICYAESLGDGLLAAGIPKTSFSGAELSETVNGVHANQNGVIYFVYMRVGKDQFLGGSPEIVQFDSRKGAVKRQGLRVEQSDCCGSPDGIDFTRDYLLISFHDNPSANTVVVVDQNLKLIELLYGFDFHEVSPNQVVYIENMVHFAPQHPERLRIADLRSGRTEELYPIKADTLRADFAQVHKLHMPSQAACRQNNDPCRPDLFDETIDVIAENGAPGFRIRVTRDGTHPWVTKGDAVYVPFEQAVYSYQRSGEAWRYCSRQISMKYLTVDSERTVPDSPAPDCQPDLPVVADGNAGAESPFPAIIRKVK